MSWVIVWVSRRGKTGRGKIYHDKEEAESTAADLNFDHNPDVLYKVIPASELYVVAWHSTVSGRSGTGSVKFTREEALRIAEDLNRQYPTVIHEAVPLPVHEPVTAKRKQEVYERQPSDEHENSLPDFERQGRERRVLNKPPTDKVNNRHTQHDDQKHDKLVDKAVSRSEVNRRQKVRYDK